MRLSKERFEMIKNADCSKSCADCKLSDCYSNQELIDEIEALQKENNGWQERYYELDAGHSRLFKDFCKLQQENEQLQAQLESLRCTSCGEIPATIGTDDGQYCEKCAEELDAVEVIDLFNYHNPADMEALEKAKNILLALENRMSSGQWPAAGTCEKCGCEISYKFHRFCHTCMHVEVITAIKALGGREDV